MSATRELPIATNGDVVVVRQQTRILAAEIGLSLVDQTKIVTAASELARNALVHAGGGRVLIEMLEGGRRPGLRLVFTDEGPGIPDIAQALTEGWSTAGAGTRAERLAAARGRVRPRLRARRGHPRHGHQVGPVT